VIEIHEVRLIETPDPDHATFEIVVGRDLIFGWVRDLARALGTVVM